MGPPAVSPAPKIPSGYGFCRLRGLLAGGPPYLHPGAAGPRRAPDLSTRCLEPVSILPGLGAEGEQPWGGTTRGRQQPNRDEPERLLPAGAGLPGLPVPARERSAPRPGCARHAPCPRLRHAPSTTRTGQDSPGAVTSCCRARDLSPCLGWGCSPPEKRTGGGCARPQVGAAAP